jgi:hypothetical protein
MNENHIVELDNKWIKEYEEDDKREDDKREDDKREDDKREDDKREDDKREDDTNLGLELFYKDNIKIINIIFIYLETKNNESSIIHVKKNKRKINSFLSENELFNLIINNKNLQNNTYVVSTVFKYNFTINPNELLKNGEKRKIFLHEHTTNFPIYFNPSIKIFENLNSLYFIMEKRKSTKSTIKTRKTYLKRFNKKNNKTRHRIFDN